MIIVPCITRLMKNVNRIQSPHTNTQSWTYLHGNITNVANRQDNGHGTVKMKNCREICTYFISSFSSYFLSSLLVMYLIFHIFFPHFSHLFLALMLCHRFELAERASLGIGYSEDEEQETKFLAEKQFYSPSKSNGIKYWVEHCRFSIHCSFTIIVVEAILSTETVMSVRSKNTFIERGNIDNWYESFHCCETQSIKMKPYTDCSFFFYVWNLFEENIKNKRNKNESKIIRKK